MKQTIFNEAIKSKEIPVTESKPTEPDQQIKINNIVEFIDPTFKKNYKSQTILSYESKDLIINKGEYCSFFQLMISS